MRQQRLEQVGHAFAVFGGDLDGITQAQRIAFGDAEFPGAPFRLVGDEDQRGAAPPQPIGEMLVERGDAGARVEDQQRHIGIADRHIGLFAHPARQGGSVGILESGGIDSGEDQVVQVRLALAAVAGDAGRIVDDRQLAADQPVEQRRLADIGTPDNGDGGEFGHRRGLAEVAEKRTPLPQAGGLPSLERSG